MKVNSNTTSTKNHRIRRFLPVAMIVALGAILVAPASSMAARFGSELTPDTQPSNAGDGHECAPNPGYCTWVMNEAYGRPDGGEKAPHKGKLKRIRLIANVPGSFRLQIVKVRPDGSAKVVRKGPKVDYQGQSDPNALDYEIETFPVNIRIKRGHRLAIKTQSTSLVRCSSGGPNSLLYQPPLAYGAGFNQYDATDGCWLLIEGVVKKYKKH
jgi:hypothetical protein